MNFTDAEAHFKKVCADAENALGQLRARVHHFLADPRITHPASVLPMPLPRTLLIVEDSPEFARAIHKVLRATFPDLAIAAVGTVAEARGLLGLDDVAVPPTLPGVLLLDMNLPDGDGWELARDVATACG